LPYKTRNYRKFRRKDTSYGKTTKRRKQLLDDFKETTGYLKLKEKSLDYTLWRTLWKRLWPYGIKVKFGKQ
jgi:hypothetical protein